MEKDRHDPYMQVTDGLFYQLVFKHQETGVNG